MPEGSVDVVISNGDFTLCLDEPKVLAEVFRALQPAGRLQMAAMPQEVELKGAWSD